MSNTLDEALGKDHVSFNSVHNATQACMEMLGARSHMIVTILPVTTEPDILSGIMRSGAHPMLLDTDEDGIFYDPEGLQEALGDLEGAAVVLLPRTASEREPEAVASLLEDIPTVVLNQHTPGAYSWVNAPGDFQLYYLSPWIGCGAVIQTRYEDQLHDLRQIRSAVLGLNAELPEELQRHAMGEWMQDAGLSASVERKPLHLVPEVARRWMEAPDYPNAEAYYERTQNGQESTSTPTG